MKKQMYNYRIRFIKKLRQESPHFIFVFLFFTKCLLNIIITIIILLTEADIYVRGNQGLDYDTKKQYNLDITCADQRRSVSSIFYIYLLRNNPPYFTNLQGTVYWDMYNLTSKNAKQE